MRSCPVKQSSVSTWWLILIPTLLSNGSVHLQYYINYTGTDQRFPFSIGSPSNNYYSLVTNGHLFLDLIFMDFTWRLLSFPSYSEHEDDSIFSLERIYHSSPICRWTGALQANDQQVYRCQHRAFICLVFFLRSSELSSNLKKNSNLVARMWLAWIVHLGKVVVLGKEKYTGRELMSPNWLLLSLQFHLENGSSS